MTFIILTPICKTNIFISVIPIFILMGIAFIVESRYFNGNICKRILEFYILVIFIISFINN